MSNKYLDIAMEKIIKQEISKVLGQIKTEIEQNIGDNPYKNDGIYCSLHIIDKHMAESEKWMNLIIDIPKEIYELITNDKSELKGLAKAVKNGTPIPDNVTNGDVMKAVFNCKTSNEDSDYLVKYSLDGIYEEVSSNWWNASYQKGDRRINNE